MIADLCTPRILRPCFTFIPIRILVSNCARSSKDKNETAEHFTTTAFCIIIFFSELHKIPAFQRISCCIVHCYKVRNVMPFMRRNSSAHKKKEVLPNILKTHYWNIYHDKHFGLGVSFPPQIFASFPPYATLDARS